MSLEGMIALFEEYQRATGGTNHFGYCEGMPVEIYDRVEELGGIEGLYRECIRQGKSWEDLLGTDGKWDEIPREYPFYKDSPDNKVMWVDNYDTVGEHLFSFDGDEVYNLFRDYPHNMTEAEVAIFDSEYPEWAEFFKDRKTDNNFVMPVELRGYYDIEEGKLVKVKEIPEELRELDSKVKEAWAKIHEPDSLTE